jgi:hypothetical protein
MAVTENSMWAEIGHLKEAVNANTEAVKIMSQAVERLVRVEERQSQMNEGQQRLGKVIDDIAARLATLERDMPMLRMIRKWVLAAVTGIVALVFVALFSLVLKAS